MLEKVKSIIKTSIAKLFVNNTDYSTWIFSSSFNTKFNYNSKYLFEYVLKNMPEISPIYIINDDKLREQLKLKYGEEYFIETRSVKGIMRVLKSGVWFTSAGLPTYGFKLNQNRIIVNLWHGVPLKKINLMEEKIGLIRKIFIKHVLSSNYSHILTTSENLVEIMKKSFGVEEEKIKVWGQPRNDVIFDAIDVGKTLENLYKGLPKYKRVILYAPTYRENRSTKFFPFPDFDQTKLHDFLEEKEIIIFIRCHQSEVTNIDKFSSDRVQLINNDIVEDIMDVINIFDLLITDYSSIYIDFLLTEKPVLFLPYDKEEYTKLRGFNFDYASVTPGPKPNSFKEFRSEIVKLIEDNTYFHENRKHINNFFNTIKKRSASGIVDSINREINKLNNQ